MTVKNFCQNKGNLLDECYENNVLNFLEWASPPDIKDGAAVIGNQLCTRDLGSADEGILIDMELCVPAASQYYNIEFRRGNASLGLVILAPQNWHNNLILQNRINGVANNLYSTPSQPITERFPLTIYLDLQDAKFTAWAGERPEEILWQTMTALPENGDLSFVLYPKTTPEESYRLYSLKMRSSSESTLKEGNITADGLISERENSHYGDILIDSTMGKDQTLTCVTGVYRKNRLIALEVKENVTVPAGEYVLKSWESAEKGDIYRVMLLDSLSALRPLCEALLHSTESKN